MKWYAKLYTRLVFIFLYLPIIVLIAFSFNESKSRASWTGFSFHWYKELFHNELILSSLRNTLIIALAASVIALVLGTMAAVGIYAMRRKWFKSLVMNITYLPILNPEIVTGVSMLLLFVSFGNGIQKFNNWIGGTALSFLQLPEMQLGFVTLIIAHVTFCTPYVILNVLPKLRQMDRFTFEAAQDLGCSPKLAFYKVVIRRSCPAWYPASSWRSPTRWMTSSSATLCPAPPRRLCPSPSSRWSASVSARRSMPLPPSYLWWCWRCCFSATITLPARKSR